MGREEPAFRKKINSKQIELLYILYRFRFATTDQVAAYQGKPNGTRVYPRIMTLVEQGYIGRNFEAEYRKKDQHASYYLMPKGLNALKGSSKTLDTKVLHNIYGDKDASEQFITESLAIFDAYCHLKGRYGDKLQFFTKSDLVTMNVQHFPQPLPAAYLRLKEGDQVKQYFLDVHPSTKPFFKSSQRIKQYATHADSKAWNKTREELPKILALCDTDTMQRRLQKRMAKENHPQLSFLLTAGKALSRLVEDTHIWQPADRPNELEGLESA